ncbi:MAG: hypothetical protein AAGB19_13780, partial [Cyanobacteria bacterium P01_F01_bin.3]
MRDAQRNALIDHAIEVGAPPGTVIARPATHPEKGHIYEVLLGWERVAAFTHPDAYPHAKSLPLGVIECNQADAAFYAIEYASQDHESAGVTTSPLLYAAAAQSALEHFSQRGETWTIKALADALCIARPTLSNRLRLLRGLQPKCRELLQEGLLNAQCAKFLLAEPSPQRQVHLATRAARGKMSSRVLYQLINPDYEPPKLMSSRKRKSTQSLGDLAN